MLSPGGGPFRRDVEGARVGGPKADPSAVLWDGSDPSCGAPGLPPF